MGYIDNTKLRQDTDDMYTASRTTQYNLIPNMIYIDTRTCSGCNSIED